MRSARLLRNAAALLILAALFLLVDFAELLTALSQLSVGAVLGLLVISAMLILLSALKWKLFIKALSKPVSVLRLFMLYMVGYFINLLLPSYIGGDAVRSFYIGREVGQHHAAAATIMERYTGLVAMMILALVCMWLTDLVTVEIKLAVALMAVGLMLITLLSLSSWVLKVLAGIPRLASVVSHLKRIQDGFHAVRGKPGLLAATMVLSFLYHSLTVVNTLVAAWAVGWDSPPLTEMFVVLPVILLIGSLPLTPSGLGLQEGAFFYFLQGLGATPAQALGIGIVLRAKSYVLALIGWLVWATLPRNVTQAALSGSEEL